MDIQTFTAAEGADPTRLRLERVPDPLNPHVSSGNTDKLLTTRVNFTRPEAWVALISKTQPDLFNCVECS
jgi:hypothetical protein